MKLSVVGLGKLGAPLAAVFASGGHEVTGVDLVDAPVESLNRGIAPVDETGLQELLDEVGARLSATTSISDAARASDISFVIVPTPSGPDGTFQLEYVLPAVAAIGEAAGAKATRHLVVITSTVMPGATDGPIRETLQQASGLAVGEGIGLCYSPEFIALGSVIRDLRNPDFILVGESDPTSGDLLEQVLTSVVSGNPPVMRMNLVNAELAKIAVNTFVTTKISYANMLAEICEGLPGADVDVVTGAIGLDSRIGAKYLRGATPYGGPCFPRDNIAFSRLARLVEANADIAEATDRVNRRQIDRLVAVVEANLGPRRCVAILGLSYKPETPVVDEATGVELASRLAGAGVETIVYDPMAMKAAKPVLGDAVTYAASMFDAVKSAEVVVVATAWSEFATVGSVAADAGVRVVVDCWRQVAPSTEGVKIEHLGRG